MKTILYKIEDFSERVDRNSTVLYDYTIESRTNPLPSASITFSLFGISLAGEIIEFQDGKVITLLNLSPEMKDVNDGVNNALREFETIATRDYNARPGRYDRDVLPAVLPSDQALLSTPVTGDILRRLDRLEEQHQHLERFVTHVYGGRYDE